VELQLGVMVVFVAAIGWCYGCGSIALSTRVFCFENEQVVKEIAFIFGTVVTGCKRVKVRVFQRKGGLLSMMATVMVRLLRGQIPMAAHVGMCTVEGVLLEIVYFPNYPLAFY